VTAEMGASKPIEPAAKKTKKAWLTKEAMNF